MRVFQPVEMGFSSLQSALSSCTEAVHVFSSSAAASVTESLTKSRTYRYLEVRENGRLQVSESGESLMIKGVRADYSCFCPSVVPLVPECCCCSLAP